MIYGQTKKNEYSSTGAKVAKNCFSDLYVFSQFSNPKKVFFSGAGVSPGDFKRPFSRKQNKISIAARVRNVLRIPFPSLIQSLGLRERGRVIFHLTPDIPVNINKLIRDLRSRMEKCANL